MDPDKQLKTHVPLGEGSLFCRTAGSGPPLVLLHGYSNSGAVWDPFLPTFAMDFQVFVLDLPGHGSSDRLHKAFTHQQTALDVLAALAKLGVEKFTAVGHSSGGMILLHIALQHPERLHKMILVSSAPRIPEGLRETSANNSLETLPLPMLEALRRWHPGGDEQIRWIIDQQRRMLNDVGDMNIDTKQLASISIPTLIVHGARDPLLPLEIAREMNEYIQGSELLAVPDAGHEFILEKGSGAEMFRHAAAAFLAGPDST